MAAAPIIGYRRKRERSAIESNGIVPVQDEDYIRNKRLLRESLRVMTLTEQREKPSLVANTSSSPPGTVNTSSAVLSDNNSITTTDITTFNDDQSVCSSSEFSRLNSLETVYTEEESEDERSRCHRSQYNHYHPPQQQTMSGGIAGGEGIADPTTFIATFKGGRKQYVRKVDYLVDELIRKTRRTLQHQPGSQGQEEGSIPNVIGPHPAVDHALSLLLPPLPLCDFQSIEQSQAGNGSDTHAGSQDGEKCKQQHRPTNLYSGNVTHGDWEIEEISDHGSERPTAPLPSDLESPSCSSSAAMSDDTEDSDMACCDDYHPSICDSRSISSMESEEERSHTMEMCSDDKYFNASSNVQAGTSSNSSQSSSFRTTTTFLSTYGDSSSCLFQSSNSSATSRLINGPDEAEDVVQVGIF